MEISNGKKWGKNSSGQTESQQRAGEGNDQRTLFSPRHWIPLFFLFLFDLVWDVTCVRPAEAVSTWSRYRSWKWRIFAAVRVFEFLFIITTSFPKVSRSLISTFTELSCPIKTWRCSTVAFNQKFAVSVRRVQIFTGFGTIFIFSQRFIFTGEAFKWLHLLHDHDKQQYNSTQS